MTDAAHRLVAILAAAFLVALGAFIWGMSVGLQKTWPHAVVMPAWTAALSMLEHGEPLPMGRRIEVPEGALREPWHVARPGRQLEGWYVFAGWDNELSEWAAWLYEPDGTRRHRWPIRHARFGEPAFMEWSPSPHAFDALPDGTLLVGMDRGTGLARLDACGEPLWVDDSGVFHHSMMAADDGSYWTWRESPNSLGLVHFLHNFDPDTGEMLRQIDLVEDVIRPLGADAQLFGLRPDYPFRDLRLADEAEIDFYHPNDIEVLREERAGDFPMFEAGDLLLSFRNLDLLTVLDPDTLRLKWWQRGPWHMQHDPDFLPGGVISVFSNNTGRERSEIIHYDPADDTAWNPLFEGEARFYSQFMGLHQTLPNGNTLIASTTQGRVLEVTADGNMVMEFNNVVAPGSRHNSIVPVAKWLPPDHFDEMPACPGR